MSEPFHVTVGMVLQRNWKVGLEPAANAFDVYGEYLVVEEIDANGYVITHWRDTPFLHIGYRRQDVTAEWFIPD